MEGPAGSISRSLCGERARRRPEMQVALGMTGTDSIEQVLLEFQRREIQVKDLGRGLVDFPALIDGREVFLCWEQDEDDIEFWHELDTGYAGRERL